MAELLKNGIVVQLLPSKYQLVKLEVNVRLAEAIVPLRS